MAAPDGNAVDWFVDRHTLTDNASGVAFEDPWRSLTRAGLATATRRFAGALAQYGIGRERRLMMLMPDTVDFPVVFWGALRAGVIPVPVNTLLTPDMVRYVLDDSRAEAVAISEPLLPDFLPVLRDAASLRKIIVVKPDGTVPDRVDDPRAAGFGDFLANGDPTTPTIPVSPDEIAFWLYSSGSTGAPKGVRHVHGSLRATAETYGSQVLKIADDDVMFSAAKAFHAYGLGNSMTFPMAAGARTVLLPDRPTPDAVLNTISRCHPTIFAAVPTLFASLLSNPMIGPKAGSDRLRLCISAGEALPAKFFQARFQIGEFALVFGDGLHAKAQVKPGGTGASFCG